MRSTAKCYSSQQQELSMEDIRLLQSQGCHVLKTLGEGAYGRVYLISHPELGEVAAKVLINNKFDANEWNIAGILNQEQAHICPYLIRYILAKQFKKLTIILYEYANMKSLTNLVKNTKESISFNLLRVIMYQLLEGMKAIHSVNLIHRDIKTDNILMQCTDPNIGVLLKITDFGLTKLIQKDNLEKLNNGTPLFLPPEILIDGKVGDNKIDMWSVGIIINPFPSGSYSELIENIQKDITCPLELKTTSDEIEQAFTPILGYNYNKKDSNQDKQQYWSLLQGLLQRDPNKRLSAEDALKHPFFDKINMPQSQKLTMTITPFEKEKDNINGKVSGWQPIRDSPN
ncbi:MAG: putative CMGC family protein kinase [Streblomastix strix]|uniref:Putative CMGC family protein kinase n=1 Tax=Streblomastix strix TaxID=222440 RepID=A0A5J4VMK6_9EUKA|nr:MAG: putative CMGC family protein kinase [Streblomastix strix]